MVPSPQDEDYEEETKDLVDLQMVCELTYPDHGELYNFDAQESSAIQEQIVAHGIKFFSSNYVQQHENPIFFVTVLVIDMMDQFRTFGDAN